MWRAQQGIGTLRREYYNHVNTNLLAAIDEALNGRTMIGERLNGLPARDAREKQIKRINSAHPDTRFASRRKITRFPSPPAIGIMIRLPNQRFSADSQSPLSATLESDHAYC